MQAWLLILFCAFAHGVSRSALALACLVLVVSSGCWAPFTYHGVPASQLPDTFRTPRVSAGPPLNFAELTLPQPPDYLLGPDDVLDITLAGLAPGSEIQPIRVRVMSTGEIYLPVIGAVRVEGLNLVQAQQEIARVASSGFLVDPRPSVVLVERKTVSVVILGEVLRPGTYLLPKYENDVAHALAAAGGLGEDAANYVEVHRQIPLILPPASPGAAPPELVTEQALSTACINGVISTPGIQIIPLRGMPPGALRPEDVVLENGDVVYVRTRKNDVFYVVGQLGTTNFVRFNVGARERDLGTGFLLPRDRDVDVVTAVAMAGYIDPIQSPTTVTVHRRAPDGTPMLIVVDLIKARYDPRETVLVQAGDIIYLNPDAWWYFRRTFDRVVDDFIVVPYQRVFR